MVLSPLHAAGTALLSSCVFGKATCWQVMVPGRCPRSHSQNLRGLRCSGAPQGATGTSSNRDWRDQGASRAEGAGFLELPRQLIRCQDDSFVVAKPRAWVVSGALGAAGSRHLPFEAAFPCRCLPVLVAMTRGDQLAMLCQEALERSRN